jgi:hypothetical protein
VDEVMFKEISYILYHLLLKVPLESYGYCLHFFQARGTFQERETEVINTPCDSQLLVAIWDWKLRLFEKK